MATVANGAVRLSIGL